MIMTCIKGYAVNNCLDQGPQLDNHLTVCIPGMSVVTNFMHKFYPAGYPLQAIQITSILVCPSPVPTAVCLARLK